MSQEAHDEFERVRRETLLEGASPEALVQAEIAALRVLRNNLLHTTSVDAPSLHAFLQDLEGDLQLVLDKLARREARRN